MDDEKLELRWEFQSGNGTLRLLSAVVQIRATQQPVMDLRIAELRLIESHYLQCRCISNRLFSRLKLIFGCGELFAHRKSFQPLRGPLLRENSAQVRASRDTRQESRRC